MNRAARARDRLKKDLPMIEVLFEYGYRVRKDGGERDQNFSCDLHGDGKDSRPSAIYYPRSNSFHCFACARSRDTIALVMEKEGLKFWPSVRFLEKKYGLPPLPWEDEEPEEKKPSLREEISEALSTEETYTEVLERTSRFLKNITLERSLTPEMAYSLWESFDRVLYSVRENLVGEDKGKLLLLKTLSTSKELLRRSLEGAE